MVYSLCVWIKGGILRSVIRFFVFDSNTKRLVIKNKEPCTKWIMLKIPSLVHFRRGSESLFYIICVCGCTGEPGLCSAVLTRQSTETQHYAHCDLLGDLARQRDKVCGLHRPELH